MPIANHNLKYSLKKCSINSNYNLTYHLQVFFNYTILNTSNECLQFKNL